MSPLDRRANLHATLGEPNRLAIVDELLCGDRTPSQLGQRLDLSSNLVAHHLETLEAVGLIERLVSSGDRRRRYVRLLHRPLADLVPTMATPQGPVLFVCTHNSARSQLAAALWIDRTGQSADSAGTHPAEQVHPKAVMAASRAGLELDGARPTVLVDDRAEAAGTVITVCDQANEELGSPPGWWHWSTPDPAAADTNEAFDAAIADIDLRIAALH